MIKLLSQLKKRISGLILNKKPKIPATVLTFAFYPLGFIAIYIFLDIASAFSTILLFQLAIILSIVAWNTLPTLWGNSVRRATMTVKDNKSFTMPIMMLSANNKLTPAYNNSIATSSQKQSMNGNNSQDLEKRFQSIFENIKIGIAIIDASGKIETMNPAFKKTLGLCGEELTKKTFEDLFYTGDNKSGAQFLDELIAGKRENLDIEIQLTNSLGKVKWVHVMGGPLISNENRQQYIIVIDNITERKEAEKTKDAFVDMVAHEFKNPLMAMVSSLRLAKKPGQFPDVLQELVGIASDSAESLWATLENLLEVNRARAGRLKLASARLNIKPIINEAVINTCQTLIHHIVMDIPDNLPQIVVDPAKIQLILRNLLDNAIKYSPKGGNILVFARCDDEELVVGVKDEGIGISTSDQQNLFQPFERLGAIDTLGSGLGLAVCKLLIKNHHGRIWVESEPGRGSIFYLALPLENIQIDT